MTQTAKHSPTPWEDNDAGLIYGQVAGDDDEAPFVCDVCENQPDYSVREKANAALIVRAVNNYESLRAAIGKLLPHAEAEQERLYKLTLKYPGRDQSEYEDCRHAVSFAYEAVGD